MEKGFRRINFFKGLFAQAEDWQQGEEYHQEKRRLHRKYFHRFGVVQNCLDGLNVTATSDGTSMLVSPGLALDGEGRELYLPTAHEVPIAVQTYTAGTTVFLTISHYEEQMDFRSNSANAEYSGYAFIQESPKLALTTDKPDNHQSLELARIAIGKDDNRVTSPKNAGFPGPGEIDRRYVKNAPVFRGDINDIVGVIREGETLIANRPAGRSPKDDTNILIEQIKGPGPGPHQFYMASVYPTESIETDGISWRIETFFRNGNTEYRLYFSNESQRDVRVAYQVLKFNRS